MMKTFDQVAAWLRGASEEFGDPSAPVGQLFARWQEDLLEIDRRPGADVVCGIGDANLQHGEVALILGPGFALPLPLATEPQLNSAGELCAFGASSIAPGLWALTPSLNAEGLIHVFVVLYGVPVPAPWERRIVLP